MRDSATIKRAQASASDNRKPIIRRGTKRGPLSIRPGRDAGALAVRARMAAGPEAGTSAAAVIAAALPRLSKGSGAKRPPPAAGLLVLIP